MRATIQSKERKGERWYKGAEIALPADQNAIDDAMQRAQVSGADESTISACLKVGRISLRTACLSVDRKPSRR